MKKNAENPILQRILKALEYDTILQLCELTGKSSQNLNGIINRGTIIKLLEPELIKRNVCVDWIKTGEGEMRAPLSLDDAYQKDEFGLLIAQAGSVLNSNTIYAEALKQNIKAFYHGVIKEKEPTKPGDKVAGTESGATKDAVKASG